MKRKLLILASLLLLSCPLLSAQSKVTFREEGSKTTQELEHWLVLGCTNGGHLNLAGEVRVQLAVPTCLDAACKESSKDQLAADAHVPAGQLLDVYCTTDAEDAETKRDVEFCSNNVSNPHPVSQPEREKHNAEMQQCLKDRAEYRQQKRH